MTRSHEVGCFFFGCAVGVTAVLVLAPEPRDRTMKYLRKKATQGVDYTKTGVENAREVVDNAAAKAGQFVDRVGDGLDAAKKVIDSVAKLA
jgi:hypothetical protein